MLNLAPQVSTVLFGVREKGLVYLFKVGSRDLLELPVTTW